MFVRVLLIVAGLGIPLALIVAVLPITWGYGGYIYLDIPGTSHGRITYVDPTGPAAKTGLRKGDITVLNSGTAWIDEEAGPVGTVIHKQILRKDGTTGTVAIMVVPFTGALGVQIRVDRALDAFSALAAFVVVLLVVLRARNRRIAARAALVLFFAGLQALATAGGLVWPNAWAAEILYRFLPPLFASTVGVTALWLLAVYPAHRTALRRVLAWVMTATLAFPILAIYDNVYVIATGFAPNNFLNYDAAYLYVALITILIFIASVVDAWINARGEEIAPVRWLGGMWLIAAAFSFAPTAGLLIGSTLLVSHYGDFTATASTLFIALGIAYPVFRHRLVDLNIIVSRATVFTVVSLIIVGAFVLVEWAIAGIFEHSIGVEKTGFAPQLITLAAVLVLGMSTRSIHRFVEKHLTQAFFRKRLRGLADIKRVAREADVATNPLSLMQLGVSTIQHAFDPIGVAFYQRRDGGYEYTAGSDPAHFPRAYGIDDAVPLRLRRWLDAFEIDDESDAHLHLLFVPLAVRGDLLGFLCCGPKPDRTPYLDDETRSLELLAHHTALAVALCDGQRESAHKRTLSEVKP
ncbi:MAG TPA: hypothetical protein VMD47_00610 [Candidatus Acidoferrales bacterium]|nr:hypothetical protein [Candidatus Acidoferrales bacterium]